MSLVASRVALTHRCDIERDAATAGSWGGTGEPDWESSITDLPCYASTSAAREPIDADRTVVVEDLRMLVPVDTDVTERDRVGDVTDRGSVIYPGPMGIEAVLRFPTHLELVLQRIRG